jgi:integrase
MTTRTARGQTYHTGTYRDAEGKLHRATLGNVKHTTKAQARAELNRLAQVAASGVLAEGETPTVEDWGAVVVDQLLAGREPTTGRSYRATFAHLCKCFTPERRIGTFSTADVRAFIEHLRAQPNIDGTGKATDWMVAQHCRNARRAWGLAMRYPTAERPYIARNPFAMTELPNPVHDEGFRYITLDEAGAMLAACQSPAERITLGLARLAGLRFNELARVQQADFDGKTRLLSITLEPERRGKGRSTKRAAREVPICPALWLLVEAGAPFDRLPHLADGRAARTWMRRIMARANVEGVHKPFHDLRKSLEKDWLDQHGIHACRWLGNSPSVAITHYHQTSRADAGRVTGVNDPVADYQQAMARLVDNVKNLART